MNQLHALAMNEGYRWKKWEGGDVAPFQLRKLYSICSNRPSLTPTVTTIRVSLPYY
jgi:hypothetical protein